MSERQKPELAWTITSKSGRTEVGLRCPTCHFIGFLGVSFWINKRGEYVCWNCTPPAPGEEKEEEKTACAQ
jgi:hypothetical protein